MKREDYIFNEINFQMQFDLIGDGEEKHKQTF